MNNQRLIKSISTSIWRHSNGKSTSLDWRRACVGTWAKSIQRHWKRLAAKTLCCSLCICCCNCFCTAASGGWQPKSSAARWHNAVWLCRSFTFYLVLYKHWRSTHARVHRLLLSNWNWKMAHCVAVCVSNWEIHSVRFTEEHLLLLELQCREGNLFVDSCTYSFFVLKKRNKYILLHAIDTVRLFIASIRNSLLVFVKENDPWVYVHLKVKSLDRDAQVSPAVGMCHHWHLENWNVKTIASKHIKQNNVMLVMRMQTILQAKIKLK